MPRSPENVAGDAVETIKSILDHWEVTEAELTKVVNDNPSLRGMLFGYIAEVKLTELLEALDDCSESFKYDDHDRTRKGDRVIRYRGESIVLESKSLQTNMVERTDEGFRGKAQVDASDRREVAFPDGSVLNTTLLLAGEFDVLAVNVFAFEDRWRFLFARNRDLPRSRFKRYSAAQRELLLASLVEVTSPPKPPFTEDLPPLLDEVLADRRRGSA